MSILKEIYNLILLLMEGLFSLLFTVLSEVIGPVLLGFLLIILWTPLAIFQGYILCQMWLWFIVPMEFHPITLIQAIGISLIVTLLQSSQTNVSTTENIVDQAKTWFVGQTLVFAVAYIVKSCFVAIQ